MPRSLVITGGEPLLNPLEPLLQDLKYKGYRIHLETNGTFPVPERYVDWVAVSPKTPDPLVTRCHELRVLLADGEIPDDRGIDANHYFISPLNPPRGKKINEANLRYCLNYVLHHPKWRLSIQLHKYLDIP